VDVNVTSYMVLSFSLRYFINDGCGCEVRDMCKIMNTRLLTKHNDSASIAQSEEKLTNNHMYQLLIIGELPAVQS